MPRTGKRLTYDEYMEICNKKNVTPAWTREKFNNEYKNRKTDCHVICTECKLPHPVEMKSFMNVENHGKLCKDCIGKNAGDSQRSRQSGDNKLINIENENKSIEYFINVVNDLFNSKKAYDKCKSDIIISSKDNPTKYIGIQVKTTSTINKRGFYSFNLNGNIYTDLLLFCRYDNNNMWLIPYNKIGQIKGINISNKRSPTYDKYKVNEETLPKMLLEYYMSPDMKIYSFDELNTPIDEYTRREQEFKIIREDTLSHISFEYPNHEGTNFDFKINSKKIQEKVGSINLKSNNLMFCLKPTIKYYKKGDNDFYWLNFIQSDKKQFYLLPECILLQNDKIISTVTICKQSWTDYLFDYESIDIIKLNKLLQIE